MGRGLVFLELFLGRKILEVEICSVHGKLLCLLDYNFRVQIPMYVA